MRSNIWFDARKELKNIEELILKVNGCNNFNGILYNATNFTQENLRHGMHMEILLFVKTISELEVLLKIKEIEEIIIVSDNCEVLSAAEGICKSTCYYINIIDEETMNKAHLIGQNYRNIILEFKDETNIPLELIIARLQSKDTKIIKYVTSVEEALLCKYTMEVGCDGVLLASDNIMEVIDMDNMENDQEVEKYEVVSATVTNVKYIGAGQRACIDTTNLLTKEEAMIIGSTSTGGLLVCSETHYLPYMNSRPFRVNAGAVHSYVWCDNNTTQYITDLKVGDNISIIDIEGNIRTVSIGRIKIEVRPLLLIEAEWNGKKANVIVQDDWHIRIFDGDKKPKNVTEFKVGDNVLAYFCEPGRHVGVKINETINEN